MTSSIDGRSFSPFSPHSQSSCPLPCVSYCTVAVPFVTCGGAGRAQTRQRDSKRTVARNLHGSPLPPWVSPAFGSSCGPLVARSHWRSCVTRCVRSYPEASFPSGPHNRPWFAAACHRRQHLVDPDREGDEGRGREPETKRTRSGSVAAHLPGTTAGLQSCAC